MDDSNKSSSGLVGGASSLAAGRNSMYANTVNGAPSIAKMPSVSMNSQVNAGKLPTHDGSNPDSLTHAFSGMNIGTAVYGGNTLRHYPVMTNPSLPHSAQSFNNAGPYFMNGQVMWGNHANANHFPGAVNGAQGFYDQVGTSYTNNSNAYQAFGNGFVGHSPSWVASRATSAEVPSLLTPRRDSSSSNENDIPGTPFTQFTGYTSRINILDHSPNSVAAWSTPSPTQLQFVGGKPASNLAIPLQLQLLCQQEPAIPPAVPSNTPKKALERALENPHGMTNVYIRGLQLDTSDEMLFALAARFGDIISSKSIIDHATGECKGYGFVKYHSFKDAEHCIRGFHACGYEASFARESFYNQLKKLSDESNTNLYVSNLPQDMNEAELAAIFGDHKVLSSRILRNTDGSGRGVGFAR